MKKFIVAMMAIASFSMLVYAGDDQKAPEVKEPKELAQARTAFQNQMKVATTSVIQKYLQTLDTMKKQLGGKGDIAGATAIQKEIEKINGNIGVVDNLNATANTPDSKNGGAKLSDKDLSPAFTLLDKMTWEGKNEPQKGDAGLTLISGGGNKEWLKTNASFRPPFTIKATVQTDSTNIRFYYNVGVIVFNWEMNLEELRVQDFLNNKITAVAGKGFLKQNKEHEIIIEVKKDSLSIKADGKECYKGKGDYKDIEAPVGIGPCVGSKIVIKEFTVEKK